MDRAIFIMRHGETEFNTQGRYQGQLDSPLTEHGVEQVRQMARLLRYSVDQSSEWRVISSPLGRALQSTQILCEILGYDFNKVETDSRLSEVSVGSWSGLTLKEIEQDWADRLTGTTMYDWYFYSPDGESYEAVQERVTDWLDSVSSSPQVIAVTHGLTSRILRGVYAGLTRQETLALEVSQSACFQLANCTIKRISNEFDEF
ncbi:histidine phosphatase family protein [Paenibacillus sp. RS8]|uniref:histidine phosphatase family protein n=1 Tax=Paenibacillus sp. RS8 TaxID=3242681 RepID=UPI0035C0D922